jgi:hypothetical protein
MKICFLVPDGTGIRNYLYSRLISELPEGTEVVIWHNVSDKAIAETKKIHPEVYITEERIPVYVENIQERILREASTFARLHWSAELVENDTIVTNWYKPRKTIKRKLLYKASEVLGFVAKNSYRRIRSMEQKYTELICKDKTLAPYIEFLERQKPDLVFCTHQRIPWLVPAIEAAKKLKIKTVTAIYSWDNIPKARLPLRPDKFIVWSQFMKEELHQFYPEIPLGDIIITGSPQFEFYNEHHRIWDRELFTRQFGLDPKKKLICYTGDDTDISPYDPCYLNDLAEAVMNIEEDIRPHIIFRRCPADFSDRYNEVLQKFGSIITSINPLWHSDGDKAQWFTYYPLPADINLLVNLAFHCDVSVNIASTIAHDFATFNKPTFYINYDQFPGNGWSVKVVYRFQHFRSMDGFEAVGWINSKYEIKDWIQKALNCPQLVGSDRQRWLNKIVTEDFGNASSRIAQFFSSCCYETNNQTVFVESVGN